MLSDLWGQLAVWRLLLSFGSHHWWSARLSDVLCHTHDENVCVKNILLLDSDDWQLAELS
jgi:hypothetical protein